MPDHLHLPAPWALRDVAQHNSKHSCWVVIHAHVYDVTDFLAAHPGGAAVILKYAGRDATAAFDPIHPPDTLAKHLPPDKHLGPIDSADAIALTAARHARNKTQDELRMERAAAQKPSLARILNLADMQEVAKSLVSYKALAYYASSADDEISYNESIRAFSRIFFHPRIMRRVSECDPSTAILGYKSRLPIFVSGAALAKLGHPLGEANITRGAGRTGIIQMVSSNASLSYSEIAASRLQPEQTLFFQLYKHKDDELALQRIREVESLGYKAIFLTVDAIVPGNRERDIRVPFVLEDQEREAALQANSSEVTIKDESNSDDTGTAGELLKYYDLDMTWEKTIPWLRRVTHLPIAIKGIQCVEDAVAAMEAGVDGILISNHGGRQLEYALPPIDVLFRLRRERPDVFDRLEVYIDGGVRRGTDVLKALCLGATAVGLGRPFLYAQSAYGEQGVVKIVNILEREITTGMRLLGARSVADLVPEMVEEVYWQPLTTRARL